MRYGCDLDCIAEVEVRWVMDCFGVGVIRSSEARVLSIFSKGCNAGRRRGGANAGTVKANQIRTLYCTLTSLGCPRTISQLSVQLVFIDGKENGTDEQCQYIDIYPIPHS